LSKPLTEYRVSGQEVSSGGPGGIVDFLSEHGLDLRPPMVLLLYGPPKVGKTTLSLQLARELDRKTYVFYAEPNYKNPDFQELIKMFKPRNADFIEVNKPWMIFYLDRYVKEDNSVVIFDSASAVGELVADELKTFEPLVYTSRTALVARRLAFRLQRLAAEKNLTVIIIAQATGGPGKYKGVSYKPSMTLKSMHYTDYDLLLEPVNEAQRRLVIVNARPKPWLEGKKLLLQFTEQGIQPIGEEIEEKK